jgi:HAD superfamily hydrolase (TIGR01662 family)
MTRAVLFDVDFTLIYPGPTFQGEGYRRFCARHGIVVDPARFEAAVAGASAVLDQAQDLIYDARLFIDYTQAVIRGMGGEGPSLEACAREIYEAWAANQHFHLYEEVPEVLRDLKTRGLRLGVVSNSHRPLDQFLRHFALETLVTAAVSSVDHGYMKPHPSIFEAALGQLAVAPHEAVMVGDSFAHDIAGARALGMKGVLVSRSGGAPPAHVGVPVIRSLRELVSHLELGS